MEGWKTALAMFAEDTPETRFRPAGLTSIRSISNPLQSWTKKSPFERRVREKMLIQETVITFARYFSPDSFCERLLECICDTWSGGAGGIGPTGKVAEKLYTLEVAYPNSDRVRFSGMALKSWMLLIQSGRIISEETVWVALNTESLESVTGARPDVQRMTPAAGATHLIDTSLPEVVSADWPGDGTRTFSTQIIFERELQSCNHSTLGVAERHSRGAWEVTGHGTVRLPSADFDLAFQADARASLFWQLTHPELAAGLKIALPEAVIRVNNQEALAGEIEHTLDFHAHSADNQTAFLALT